MCKVSVAEVFTNTGPQYNYLKNKYLYKNHKLNIPHRGSICPKTAIIPIGDVKKAGTLLHDIATNTSKGQRISTNLGDPIRDQFVPTDTPFYKTLHNNPFKYSPSGKVALTG